MPFKLTSRIGIAVGLALGTSFVCAPLLGKVPGQAASPAQQDDPALVDDLVEAVRRFERRHIERFEYADTWGHGMVRVRGDQVRASVFKGLERKAWKELDLTSDLGKRG